MPHFSTFNILGWIKPIFIYSGITCQSNPLSDSDATIQSDNKKQDPVSFCYKTIKKQMCWGTWQHFCNFCQNKGGVIKPILATPRFWEHQLLVDNKQLILYIQGQNNIGRQACSSQICQTNTNTKTAMLSKFRLWSCSAPLTWFLRLSFPTWKSLTLVLSSPMAFPCTIKHIFHC